jgi:hypothetical protein
LLSGCVCVCALVCLCIPPIIARQRLDKNLLIDARQRLGKNPLIVARQRLVKNPPIVARQRLSRKVTAVTNTRVTIEELFDASFSMWPVSYQGKEAIISSQNLFFFSWGGVRLSPLGTSATSPG